MIEALGHGSVDLANRSLKSLPCGCGVTRRDGCVDALDARAHIGSDTAIARGPLYRLSNSLFC